MIGRNHKGAIMTTNDRVVRRILMKEIVSRLPFLRGLLLLVE